MAADPETQSERPFGRHTIERHQPVLTGPGGTTITEAVPYMTRTWVGRLRHHHFWRGDEDPDPHDHPWDFWTFPLGRGYIEEVWVPVAANRLARTVRVVPGWQWTGRRAEHIHRVIAPWDGTWAQGKGHDPVPRAAAWPAGGMRTLVWRGRNRRKWGFWVRERPGDVAHRWVHWREYLGLTEDSEDHGERKQQ